MRLLLAVGAIAVLAAFVLDSGETPPVPHSPLPPLTITPTPPQPQCPGGICPKLREPTLVPEQLRVLNFTPARTEVSLLVPTRVTAVTTPPVVTPAAQPTPTPSVSANGWRLRLLFPERSEQASFLSAAFEADPWCLSFAKKYGYQEIQSDHPNFDRWRKNGYRPTGTYLVLVNPAGHIQFYATDRSLPADLDTLRTKLAAAVSPPPSQREANCTCVLPTSSPGKIRWQGSY